VEDFRIVHKKAIRTYLRALKYFAGIVLALTAIFFMGRYEFTGRAVSFISQNIASLVVGKLVFIAIVMVSVYHLTKYIFAKSMEGAEIRPARKFSGRREEIVARPATKKPVIEEQGKNKVSEIEENKKRMLKELKEVYK
jgi:hypothetical protein